MFTFITAKRAGMLAGRITFVSIWYFLPPKVWMSLVFSVSTDWKLVYRLKIEPKIATDMPVIITVL